MKRKMDALDRQDWIPVNEVMQIIENRTNGFIRRLTRTDNTGRLVELGWGRGTAPDAEFILPVVYRHTLGGDFIRREDWEEAKKAHDIKDKTLPPPASANGDGVHGAHRIAPLSDDYVDLVIDNNIFSDLCAPRSGKRNWLDLIRVLSVLPSIRIVVPTVVADQESTGNTAYYKDGRIVFEVFDPLNAKNKSSYSTADLFRDASRVITDDRGDVEKTITGVNPKLVIWHSPRQEEYYRQIMAEKKRFLKINNGMTKKTFEDLREITSNAGDEAIMHYCRSPGSSHPIIVVTNDTDLKHRALASATATGKAVGVATMIGLLTAIQKSYGPEFSHMLERYCQTGEPDTATPHIVKALTEYSGGRKMGKDFYSNPNTHNIFPGTTASGRPGEPLDKVLTRGWERQREWEHEQGSHASLDAHESSSWGTRVAAQEKPGSLPDHP